MTFTVVTTAGDELTVTQDLDSAVVRASEALRDDPEMGTLDVYEVTRESPTGVLRKTVTFGPDADWQSVVVVLELGEKVEPPDGSWRPVDDDGYDPSDPKHPNWHSIRADIWDARAGK